MSEPRQRQWGECANAQRAAGPGKKAMPPSDALRREVSCAMLARRVLPSTVSSCSVLNPCVFLPYEAQAIITVTRLLDCEMIDGRISDGSTSYGFNPSTLSLG